MHTISASLAEAAQGRRPVGNARRKVMRSLDRAGNAAVPSLIRALRSSQEGEARWACELLARLGGPRVIEGLGALLADRQERDPVKARALSLLTELDAPVPATLTLKDPDTLLAESVEELLSGVHDGRELRDAVRLIREQVPEDELLPFCAELVRHGARRALPVLDALLALRLQDGTLAALKALRREAAGHRTRSLDPALARTLARALEEGLDALEDGRAELAEGRLRRVVEAWPDHGEARSALGVALLQLDRPEEALPHLRDAARLEPDEPLHRWNVAAAAKQAQRMGGAYLALREYLHLDDQGDGAPARQKEARAYVRAYQRMLRDSHPGVSLDEYLRGEELFARAFAALSEGKLDEAIDGFEAVIAMVPRHYPSWGNLGVAHLQAGRGADARRCLNQALTLNPDYTPARQNLLLLAD